MHTDKINAIAKSHFTVFPSILLKFGLENKHGQAIEIYFSIVKFCFWE